MSEPNALIIVIKDKIHKTLFVLPLMLPVLIFWLFPFLLSVWISFTDWDYISADFNYVGIENYTDMFDNSEFTEALANTFYFAIFSVIPTIILGLAFALLLQKNLKSHKFYRLVVFSPWITPTIAVSIVWSWVFQSRGGLANIVINSLGFESVAWFDNAQSAMFVVVVVTVWQSIGWTMLFFLSALNKIPHSLYEASLIDGCSKLRRFFRITVPLISPTTFFLLIINLINALAAFDQFQILTQGGPSGGTRTLFYLFYQQAFDRFEMGLAAATSLVIVIITAIFTALNMWLSKRWVYY